MKMGKETQQDQFRLWGKHDNHYTKKQARLAEIGKPFWFTGNLAEPRMVRTHQKGESSLTRTVELNGRNINSNTRIFIFENWP
jgi:hypothetical protein